MIPKVISARHRGDMGDRLRVATVGRCGVHAEGAGAPPRGRKVHMRTESAAASPAAGTLHLHRYNARSPGRPCPQAPQGQGPPACSPGHTAGVPRRLARTSSLGAAPLPAGKAPASSAFAAHGSRVPDSARRQERAGDTGRGRGHREGQDRLMRTADLRAEQGAALGRPGAGSPAPGACTGWGALAHGAGETARPRGRRPPTPAAPQVTGSSAAIAGRQSPHREAAFNQVTRETEGSFFFCPFLLRE